VWEDVRLTLYPDLGHNSWTRAPQQHGALHLAAKKHTKGPDAGVLQQQRPPLKFCLQRSNAFELFGRYASKAATLTPKSPINSATARWDN